MENFNVDASGQLLRVNFERDVSTATAFSMTLQPRQGDKLSITPTLGTSGVTVGDEVLAANQYCETTTTANQFNNHIGIWRKKATATLPSGEVVSSQYTFFEVTDGNATS